MLLEMINTKSFLKYYLWQNCFR